MCYTVVASCLFASKLVPNWFVSIKMIEKLDSAVSSDACIIFGYLDYDFFAFFSGDKGLNNIFPDKIFLDIPKMKILIIMLQTQMIMLGLCRHEFLPCFHENFTDCMSEIFEIRVRTIDVPHTCMFLTPYV